MSKPMPKHLIMVVEDDPDLRETLKDMLELQDFRVVTAANGREGLDRLHDTGRPCLILLDLMMPVMNGWQFLEALRTETQGAFASMPVAIISAAPDLADLQQRYGCQALKKPIEFEQLFQLARKHCPEI